jgi:hypothetical protein
MFVLREGPYKISLSHLCVIVVTRRSKRHQTGIGF